MKRPWIFAGLLTNCTVCHDKPGSKLLTDRGKYYEAMGSLAGYDSVVTFAACTDCHTRKPGSKKLTRTGKRFADVVHDMEGLRAWLQENHPKKGGTEPQP